MGAAIGALEGANPAIRFPLTIDAASITASQAKVYDVGNGQLSFAPSSASPTRYALVTIALSTASGLEWRALTVDGVKLTRVRLASGLWALLVISSADAAGANFRTTTIDGGSVTTVFTGTGDYRALLMLDSASISGTPRVMRLFGALVAFSSVGGGFALLASGAASASPLLTSLISYWKMDEASGTRADSAGANTLTDNNTVTQAVGKIANAGQFAAVNSEYLSIADNASLSVGDIDFTWALWFMLDDIGVARALVGKYNNGSTASIEYELRILSTNVLRFFVGNGAASAASVNSTPTFSAATWYFAVAWHDSVANTINVQIDNGAAASAAYSAGGYDGTFALNIGATAASTFHNGRIDEVGFWKRVLTTDERTSLYNAGAGRTHPFLT